MSFGTTGHIRRPTKAAAVGATLLALVLAGCGSDDTPSGGSTSTTSASPSHSLTSTSPTPASSTSSPPSASSTPSASSDPALIADCTAVNGVLTGVSAQYPDGTSLTVGQAPSESNIAALTAIRDGFNGLTLTSAPLIRREKGSVKIIDKILKDPTVALTQKVVDAFNSAGTKLATVCTGVNPS